MSTESKTRVSVCIATFNGEVFLPQQLDSILIQLDINDEIIISDDGSNDKTIEIIEDYKKKDPRIKLVHNNIRKGVIGNFENSLRHCNGDIIFLCDQDDIWANNKIEKVIILLKEYDLVVHNAEIIDTVGNSMGIDFFSIRKSRSGYLNNLWKNKYLGCCMCFKRSQLVNILPFPKKIIMHDMWIGLKIQLNGKVLFTNEILSYYRRHGRNASSASEKSPFSFKEKILIRLRMLYYTLLK